MDKLPIDTNVNTGFNLTVVVSVWAGIICSNIWAAAPTTFTSQLYSYLWLGFAILIGLADLLRHRRQQPPPAPPPAPEPPDEDTPPRPRPPGPPEPI